MLGRISKLPLPPVFGCALTQSPSSSLALRFMETELTNAQIKLILSTHGKDLLSNGYVMVSHKRSGFVAIVPPEANKHKLMAQFESLSKEDSKC